MSKLDRGGCCDNCGTTGNNDPDEVLCIICKLKAQATNALTRGWAEQYHTTMEMLRAEMEEPDEEGPEPDLNAVSWQETQELTSKQREKP